jgi:hypothetical protein
LQLETGDSFLQRLQQRESPRVLAILGQSHASRTSQRMTIAIDALTKVMQSVANAQVLANFIGVPEVGDGRFL